MKGRLRDPVTTAYNRRGRERMPRVVHFEIPVNDIDRSIAFYQKVIALDPNHLEANNSLGAAYAKKGDRSGVLRQIERLKTLHRDDLADQLIRILPPTP